MTSQSYRTFSRPDLSLSLCVLLIFDFWMIIIVIVMITKSSESVIASVLICSSLRVSTAFNPVEGWLLGMWHEMGDFCYMRLSDLRLLARESFGFYQSRWCAGAEILVPAPWLKVLKITDRFHQLHVSHTFSIHIKAKMWENVIVLLGVPFSTL